jgi:hypothetical protein
MTQTAQQLNGALNNQQPNQGGPERKKTTIRVKEKEDFKGMFECLVTTTMDLSAMVNSVFKPLFGDCEGCIILPDQSINMGLQASLFFKEGANPGPERISNIMRAGTNNGQGASPADRIRFMNTRFSNRSYELTEQTKEALEDFIENRYIHNGKVQWNKIVTEVVDRSQFNTSVYVKVNGIDIYKVLRAKFGGKDKATGGRLEYAISLIGPMNMYYDGNFKVSIIQLDTKKVEEVCNKINIVPNVGSIQMVRHVSDNV